METTSAASSVPLTDPRLFRQACYVDGAWIEAGAEAITVDNPATGEPLGVVPRFGRAEIRLGDALLRLRREDFAFARGTTGEELLDARDFGVRGIELRLCGNVIRARASDVDAVEAEA